MHLIPRPLPLLAIALLSGCVAPFPGGDAPDAVQPLAEAPPGAAPGTCWGKIVTPAVIETVTNQMRMQPPEAQSDSAVTAPAIYETKTHQSIIKERNVTWFETPCPADLPPDFIGSLQRALAARDLYRGRVTGRMNGRTRAAIRRFQRPEALDSGILSLAAARRLGLVAVEIPER